jgi:hypothetical protein
VALTALLLVGLLAILFIPAAWPLPLLTALLLLALNWPLYRFFAHQRGWAFALFAIPWHWLYYLYNSLSFALGTWVYFTRSPRPVQADGALQPKSEEAQ